MRITIELFADDIEQAIKDARKLITILSKAEDGDQHPMDGMIHTNYGAIGLEFENDD